MKRVWDQVSVAPGAGGFAVHLDSRPMRLPGSANVLLLPNARMAEVIADEWVRAGGKGQGKNGRGEDGRGEDGRGRGAKGGEFTVLDLPLTRLAATAQDRIAPDPAPTVDAIAAYGGTDLLCYRADRPEQLSVRQSRQWQPWLDWARRVYGARLRVGAGINHVPQDADALAALRTAVAALDPWTLAGLGVAVPVLGSLVLGLALQAGELDAAGAHALAELDATFQAELWGADEEAVARGASVLREVSEAEQFMHLARHSLQ